MIYLASPYTHPDPAVVEERFLRTEEFVAQHLGQGFHIYSPIVHCHSLAQKYRLPTNFEFWRDYNYALLRHASELWVLHLDGWARSRGVAAELEFAKSCGILIRPIQYIFSSELEAKIEVCRNAT